MIIFILLVFIASLASILFLYRNQKVYKFRIYINDLSFKYSMIKLQENVHNLNDNFHDNFSGYIRLYKELPSYGDMMYDFKPLKLESYYSQDTIDELKKLELI